jgi:hypothetical protein
MTYGVALDRLEVGEPWQAAYQGRTRGKAGSCGRARSGGIGRVGPTWFSARWTARYVAQSRGSSIWSSSASNESEEYTGA